MRVLLAALLSFAAYRIALRIVEENDGSGVQRAPPSEVGVDVSVRT